MLQTLSQLKTAEVAFILGCITLALAYVYLRQHYSYWKRQGITQIRPSFLLGCVCKVLRMRRSIPECLLDIYNDKCAVDKPFVGFYVFHKPALFVRDPELVKRLLIKDFSKFSNRYGSLGSKSDPLGSQNLFFLKNPTWKDVRFKLTPFFSGTKLKHMFYLVEEVGRNLDAYLLSRTIENTTEQSFNLEMRELCALFTTDVIATTAYGVEANALKNPNSEFRLHGRKVFNFSGSRSLLFAVAFFLPRISPYLSMNIISQEAQKFMHSTINYVMKERRRTGKPRNDLIDILIEFNNWSHSKENKSGFIFEGDMLVAQAALFFVAGFETSSVAMAFVLYELATHADVQQRLREDIRQALILHKGKVTPELIESQHYMQMIIYEVLRFYPPLPFIDRECTLPAGESYSLDPYSKFKVPSGMPIYVPAYALHMDPQYYPNPTEFDPERFSPENRKLHTQCTYMSFGMGPHGCVGERLALMQMKIGLVHFFRHHYVTVGELTEVPMKLEPKAVILRAKGGIHLKVVRDALDISEA